MRSDFTGDSLLPQTEVRFLPAKETRPMPLTNAQLAAHFAALPSEEPARILIVNDDTAIVSTHTFNEFTTDQTIDDTGEEFTDNDRARMVGLPMVAQKW